MLSSEGQDQLYAALGCQHGSRQQSRPEISSRLLLVIWVLAMDTNPCCCMAMDPDMVLNSSMGWDFTMVSGGSAGCSHQAVPPYL